MCWEFEEPATNLVVKFRIGTTKAKRNGCWHRGALGVEFSGGGTTEAMELSADPKAVGRLGKHQPTQPAGVHHPGMEVGKNAFSQKAALKPLQNFRGFNAAFTKSGFNAAFLISPFEATSPKCL